MGVHNVRIDVKLVWCKNTLKGGMHIKDDDDDDTDADNDTYTHTNQNISETSLLIIKNN